MAAWGDRKSSLRFHVDEMWQYSYSNSGGLGTEPISTEDFGEWISPQVFWDYVTVHPDDRFNYAGVVASSYLDVHPPLSHLVLHTVSSIFPDIFSKWLGLGVNFACYALTIVGLYLLGTRLFRSNTRALIAAGLWAFSSGAIDTVMYIRMYCPLTLFAVWSGYFALRYLQTRETLWLAMMSVAFILGGLTDYIFWIFGFFLTLAFALIQWRASPRHMFQFSAAAFTALIAACLIYPNTIMQFLRDDSITRSTASTFDLKETLSGWFNAGYVIDRFFQFSSERVLFLRPVELYALIKLTGLLVVLALLALLTLSVIAAVTGDLTESDKRLQGEPSTISNELLHRIRRTWPSAFAVFRTHVLRASRGIWTRITANKGAVFVATATILCAYTMATLFPDFDIWTARGFFFLFPFCSLGFAGVLFLLYDRMRTPTVLIAALVILLMLRSYATHPSPFLFEGGYTKLERKLEGASVVVVLDHVDSIGRLANLCVPLSRAREIFVLQVTMDNYRQEILKALDTAQSGSKLMVVNMSGGWPSNQRALEILGPELLLTSDMKLIELLLQNGYTGRVMKRAAELFQWFSLYEVTRSAE